MRRTLKQRQVRTAPPATPAATPRLPHERDESADSQAMGAPRGDMQQAYDDLERGLVDTDLRGATPGTTQAPQRNDPPGTPKEGRSPDPNTQKLPDGNARKDTGR